MFNTFLKKLKRWWQDFELMDEEAAIYTADFIDGEVGMLTTDEEYLEWTSKYKWEK